jgi:hypothetical protein
MPKTSTLVLGLVLVLGPVAILPLQKRRPEVENENEEVFQRSFKHSLKEERPGGDPGRSR